MTLNELKQRYLSREIEKKEYIDGMHERHQILFDYADYLSNSGIERIEITADGVLMTISDGDIRLHVPRADKRVIPIEILNFGAHEAQEWRMISRLLPARPVVFDIGANVGWYTIRFARFDGGAEVHAFEPVPYTYEALRANLVLNSIDGVVVNNRGLWETAGEMDIFFDPSLSGAASARDILGTKPPATRCRFTTLDEYRSTLDTPVDFIKCDVEGGELFVFKGGLRTLETDRPVVFAELLRKWAATFGYHPRDVVGLLHELGYGCYEISEKDTLAETTIDDSTAATNFFFLHEDAHRAIIEGLSLSTNKER